jgi:hypothetical protein
LFAIKKVGQQKTLSGQRKTLSSQQKYFPVNEKHFPVKEKFGLVSRKMFSLLAVFVCHYKSWSTENTFQSKKNLAWFSGKCFPGKFGRKTLSGKL